MAGAGRAGAGAQVDHAGDEQGGLVDTLRWYVNAVSGQQLTVTTELPAAPIKMSQEGEIVLFRLVQECLNYIVGRPGARDAHVTLSGDGTVLLQVTIHGPPPLGLPVVSSLGRLTASRSFARRHCAPVSIHFTISVIVPLLAPVST